MLRPLLVGLTLTTFAHAGDMAGAERMRRPVAMVRVGKTVVVGNRTSGSLSFVDPASRRVTREVDVVDRLSGLARVDDETLLVTDVTKHELVRVQRGEGDGWSIVGRTRVARYPIDVVVVGQRAVVASSWSRRLSIVSLADDAPEPTTLDLPFIPGRQLPLPDGTLVVAGALDGRLALVELDPPRIRHVVDLPGHNVGGLALDTTADRLLVTQPVLRDDTGTTYENVFWGGVLKNVLQSIPLDQLRSGELADPPDLTFLGFPSDAAGDPGAVAVTPAGGTVVAMAGVDAIHVRTTATAPFEALPSGRRPADVVLVDDGRLAIVANTFDDSLTLVDLERLEQAGTISLGPSPEPTLAERGESLFHDARLSLDGWYSCHTCHTNGHTSNQRTDNLGDGYFGDPKRIPTLHGTHSTGPWAWNASSPSLEHQIEKSILKTMRGEVAEPEDVRALVAYVGSLERAPSIQMARELPYSEAAHRGRGLFGTHGCIECHTGERTAPDSDLYDVGLSDKSGNTEFNPPSLRGVSQREGFLHDGRAATLRSVFEEHEHPNGLKLSPRELADLLEYLRTK